MEQLTARGRTILTLGVLAALLAIGLAWGWSKVTEPYPAPLQSAPCTTRVVTAGDTVTPDLILVSVLNAGGRSGLAGDTRGALADAGFGAGELGNAPANAATSRAVIWAEPDDIGARLVATYLGGDVEIVDQPSSYPGITVLVGEGFAGVSEGEPGITAETDGRVCVPN